MNYREFLASIALLRPLRGYFGQRLVGMIALLHDFVAEGVRQAVRAPWVGDNGTGPAYDGLTASGHETSLPRYPAESWEQYHARLQRVWVDWPLAGDEMSIVAQLEAAGFPGAIIYGPMEWDRPPEDWWSQFWVFFPAGTHIVTAAAPLIGGFTVGDGTIVGPVGITPLQLRVIRSIISKFKPGHYVCREIIFEISGWTVGDGHSVGDSGLTIGGSQAVVGAA